MKSLYKSAIAIAVFGTLFSASTNVANAAEAMIQTTDGSNVFLSVNGQDESIKKYDLDDMASVKDLNGLTNRVVTIDDDLNSTKDGVLIINDDLQTSKQILSDKAQIAQDTANSASKEAFSAQTTANQAKADADLANTKADANAADLANETAARKQDISNVEFDVAGKVSQQIYDADKQDQGLKDNTQDVRITKLESLPAPNGAKGDKGDTGATGAKGDKGDTGAQGPAGRNGRDGVNGHNGKDGVTTTVTQKQVDTATQAKVAKNSLAVNAATQELQATRQTLQAMNNATSQQFKSLREEVDNNKKQANAGISGAMAMAGLPQVQTNQRVMFSAGGATYNGESALAVGASVNFSSHVIAKVSFSDDTANNMGASVGIGLGF